MEEKVRKEIEELLDQVENDIKQGDNAAALDKVGSIKDKIKTPLPGTGSNGLER